MKNVCVDCKSAKKKPNGVPSYCKKYGIPLWSKKIYCVSKEPEGGARVVQVSGERTGEQIPFTEDRC